MFSRKAVLISSLVANSVVIGLGLVVMRLDYPNYVSEIFLVENSPNPAVEISNENSPGAGSFQTGIQLRPVDDASMDPSFLKFRERSIDAVERRDGEEIVRHLSPDVMNSFGGKGGIDEFREKWTLEQDGSEFWTEFGQAIRLGGAFMDEKRSVFCAPYVAANWRTVAPRLEKYGEETVFAAVIVPDAQLLSKPDESSQAVAKLSYDVVKINDPKAYWASRDPNAFIAVTQIEGATGYIRRRQLRTPVEYSACFENKNGSWQITKFTAGD